MVLSAAALSLAVALAAPGSCGLPALLPARPFAPGEELTYDVSVAGVVKGGTLELSVEAPILGGAQLPLRARARNTSVFAKIRKVKGTGVSFVWTRTLRPSRYRDDVEQDGVKRSTDTRLDLPGPTVKMAWTSGAEKGMAEFERQRESLDLLSAIYLLRAARLEPGADLCFDLLANRRYWRFAGKVAARTERVPTPAGDFDTIRVDARLTRADDPTKGRPLVLWFSDDARRLLVAAGSEVDLGPVVATLVRAE